MEKKKCPVPNSLLLIFVSIHFEKKNLSTRHICDKRNNDRKVQQRKKINKQGADHSSVVSISLYILENMLNIGTVFTTQSESHSFCFQKLLNHCSQGRCPFAMQAALGVVGLQQCVSSAQKNKTLAFFFLSNKAGCYLKHKFT